MAVADAAATSRPIETASTSAMITRPRRTNKSACRAGPAAGTRSRLGLKRHVPEMQVRQDPRHRILLLQVVPRALPRRDDVQASGAWNGIQGQRARPHQGLVADVANGLGDGGPEQTAFVQAVDDHPAGLGPAAS